MASRSSRCYPPGIHVPSLTWFKDDVKQTIDWQVQEKHLTFLIESGLHGSELQINMAHAP